MIQPIYVIKSFNPLAAVTLIVITAVKGYVFGYAGAIIWNKLHRPVTSTALWLQRDPRRAA